MEQCVTQCELESCRYQPTCSMEFMADNSVVRFQEVGTVMALFLGLQDAQLVCRPEVVRVTALSFSKPTYRLSSQNLLNMADHDTYSLCSTPASETSTDLTTQAPNTCFWYFPTLL